MLPNVWSLVIGSLAESVISFLLSYLICPFLPRLTFHSQPFRELLSFSRGLFGLSFLNLIFVKSDIFVIGKVLGPLDLGLYTMAVSLVQAPTGFIMNLLGQTLLSGLAKIRNDDGRVIKILLDVTSTLLFLGLPCTVFLTVFGKSFLTLAYGQKYAPMAPVLALAGLTSLLNLANAQITTIFFAKGVPHLHRRCVIVMACSMVIVSYPLIKVVGPMGGQLACLLAIVMGYVVQIRGLRAITGIRFNQYVRCYFEPLILASVVLALCLGLRRLHLPYEPGSTIVCGIMVCIAAYAFTAALLFYDNRLRRSFGNGDAELRRW
jgi:O-antigen/teichoic acid export membrane protein